MQTIGERLEEARKRKGISIREAAEATKIRSDYLQKFEANSFDIDLPALYLKGFLRSYARYLELDADRLTQDLAHATAGERKPGRRETREVYGRVDFSENARASDAEDEAKPAETRRPLDQAVLIKYGLFGLGALFLILIVVVLINLFSTKSSSPAKPAEAPSTAAISAPVSADAVFTITVLEPTRVKIAYQDGSSVFLDGKFPLARGEVKNISFAKDLLVTVEQPERIKIELNGASVEVPTKKTMGQFIVPYQPKR